MTSTRTTRQRGRNNKTRRNLSGRSMNITTPKQYRAAHELLGRSPLSLVLIFSHSCGHCKTFLPIWEKLAEMKHKKSNMIRMEADVFQNTPLSKKAAEHGIEINAVPTVLLVKDGKVSVADDIRNETMMTDMVSSGSLPSFSQSMEELSKDAPSPVMDSEPEAAPNMVIPPAPEVSEPSLNMMQEPEAQEPEPSPNMNVKVEPEATEPSLNMMPEPEVEPEVPRNETMMLPNTSSKFKSVLPGVLVQDDSLHALPASTVSSKPKILQSGGSPWAAFLTSVAPAATLLSAYSLLPKKNPRSSGLKRVSRRNKKMTRA
jgi:thiol-disulfide isomerase/thioredoxin